MSMRHPEFGYWVPDNSDRHKSRPEPGDLVACDFKPWRVIDIREKVPHEDNPNRTYTVYRMRPLDAGDSNKRDIHRGWTYGGPPVLNEHYGLCIHCGELTPCREVMSERKAKEAMKRMDRYATPGVCPECQEPVTHRQEHETFPNIVMPGGPPVTFHAGRRKCRYSMNKYREKVGQPEAQMRLDAGEGFK